MGTYWGYEDHLLYRQALRKLNHQPSPRTDVFLSVSTHSSWLYPRSTHFQDIVKNKIIQNKTLSKQQKADILNSVNIYGCFAYSDLSLQQLMENYQKRDDFNNTIFIITGDHHAFSKQFGGSYNYHVPLIIYSPMLKCARNMKGVVSHRDITPSLLSLLQDNYNIKTPTEVPWLNTALDTSLTFNANTFSPLQLIDHTLGGIIYKNYMLSESILEEFTDGGPRKINDPNILQKTNRMLSLYQSIERYILYNDALLRNNTSKRKQAKVIINIEDTIAQGKYFDTNSELKIVEGPEGHNTTLYFDALNLYPIGSSFIIPCDKIEKFMVEIEFMIYIKNDDINKNLKLIMDVTKNDESVSYNTEYFTSENQNRWYTFKKMLIYKKELFDNPQNKYKFKVHIWNNDELKGYIDDIKVKVTAY
jgi:hypothetical protein